MNFDLSEEQALLRDSFARFVRDAYPFQSRRRIAAEAKGFSQEHWQTFAELGWLSLPFDEEHGGAGCGAVHTMLLMEEFGKGLVLEPYLSTVLLFGGLLQRAGANSLRNSVIPKIIDGSVQGGFAYLERQSRFELADVCTSLVPAAGGFVLNGEKTVVFNGAIANQLVVSARSYGGQYDEDGVSLVWLDAAAPGIERTAFRLMDGQLVANIRLRNVKVEPGQVLGKPGEGFAPLRAVVDDALLALGAEALGIMHKLNEITLDYVKTRKQFGVPIGSFQALQHRLVDMFAACEQTRSLLYRAVCSIEEQSADAHRNIIALKVMVGNAGRLIGGEAIQLHGGMGITDELSVGQYVKRLIMINATLGDADHHLRRFASLSYG
jgi:alkylation response protein AidB-like acyl-CoA dehydrogenase